MKGKSASEKIPANAGGRTPIGTGARGDDSCAKVPIDSTN